eukprot:10847554-Heterocapsa_arctica.AAC.1
MIARAAMAREQARPVDRSGTQETCEAHTRTRADTTAETSEHEPSDKRQETPRADTDARKPGLP